MHNKVIAYLKEKFGEDMGAGDYAPVFAPVEQDGPITNLNDERVLKMN